MKHIFSIFLILAISISVNAQKVLFLDAGHGGKDQGAIASTGMSEAQINQAFVQEIKKLAEAKGIKVVLLSSPNVYTPLMERIQKINNYKLKASESGMLLSIHANFSTDPTKKGREVMVLTKDKRSAGSFEFAQKMSNAIDATIIEKGLGILQNVNIPAILIETGYLSNEIESMDLQMPDMRTLLVRKILAAL